VRERAGGAARGRPPGLGRLRGAQAPAPRYFQTALSSEPRQKRLLRRSTHSWVAATPFRVAARARHPWSGAARCGGGEQTNLPSLPQLAAAA